MVKEYLFFNVVMLICKNTKKALLKVLFLFFIEGAFPVLAGAMDLKDRLKKVAEGEGAGYPENTQEGSIYFAEKIGEIISILLAFLGVIFIVLIIYGGFLWMTAGGNEDQVGRAKKFISNATIGLVIVLFSYALTYFVLYQLGKSSGFPTGLN